jgi:hypothetical protein
MERHPPQRKETSLAASVLGGWRLSTVAGAADSASGEHHGARGMLGEVSAGSDGDQRRRLWEGPRWWTVGLRPLHTVQLLSLG